MSDPRDTPVDIDVVRDRAALSRIAEGGRLENVYRLQVMNATEQTQSYTVTADGLQGLAMTQPLHMSVGPAEARWVSVSLRVPPQTAQSAGSGAHEIHFRIVRDAAAGEEQRQLDEKSTFVVPR